MIELRHLRCFLGIARERTITRAAEALHISQPALSRTLQELEEDLGVQLISRGKPLRLTVKGELLRQRAEALLEFFAHIKAEVGAPASELAGTITLAAGESPAVSFLARCFYRLQSRWPKVSFALKSGNETEVTEALDSGLADFGILIASPKVTCYEHLILPLRDTWALWAPEELELAKKPHVTAPDLTGLPLICSMQAIDNNELSGWLGEYKTKLKIIGSYNLAYNAYIFARESRACLISLKGLVQPQPEDRMVMLPLFPVLDAQLQLVWRQVVYASALDTEFLKVIKEELTRGLPPLTQL